MEYLIVPAIVFLLYREFGIDTLTKGLVAFLVAVLAPLIIVTVLAPLVGIAGAAAPLTEALRVAVAQAIVGAVAGGGTRYALDWALAQLR